MQVLQVIAIFISAVHVICTNEESIEVSLNQGEYIPTKRTESLSNIYYSPPVRSRLTIMKRIDEVPTVRRKIVISPPKYPTTVSYAAVHQTKIMPIKIVRSGRVKHIYLPEIQNIPQHVRPEKKVMNNRRSGFVPAKRYMGQKRLSNTTIYGSKKNYNTERRGDNIWRENYMGLKKYNTKKVTYNPEYNLQYYLENHPYTTLPKNSLISGMLPAYQNGYPYKPFLTDVYKINFNTTANRNISQISNSPNIVYKVSNLNSGVSNLVQNISNNTIQNRFAVVKSRNDSSVYLVGKPGVVQNIPPNILESKLSDRKKENT